MAKKFKDFTFCGEKFSNLLADYISVDFDADGDVSLSMARDMEVGDSNRYKVEANTFYDKWSDNLEIELDIMKNPCKYDSQENLEITKSDIRELTRWLTSSHFPEWLNFEYDNETNDAVRYYGWFSNIETFVAYGSIYGIRMTFRCTTPFGYTSEIVDEISVSNYKNILISNDSDELESSCYPSIVIKPHANGEIYICNLNDVNIIVTGTLTLSSTSNSYFNSLLDAVEGFASANNYTLEYTGSGAYDIVSLCDGTAVQFNLTDIYGVETKCTAYYMPDTHVYSIIENGFMYMKVYKDLTVYMDCLKLTINDELGRMITYDRLGINDVDYMYWLQLLHGNNSILLYGNADFTFKHIESRKVGE